MYFIGVAIFKKGLREELSFWSAKELVVGTIVSVPVRARYVLGLVLKCEPLALQKNNIKNAPFKLKKITKTIGKLALSSESINELINFSSEYVIPVSEILGDAIGEEGLDVLMQYEPEQLSQKSITYIHEPRNTRLILYKRFVREALSGNKTNKKLIIIVTPTKALGRKIYNEISPGIEKSIILSQESGEKAPKLFKNICSSGKSVCLITNSKNAFALLPFADFLIVDDCGSRFYANNKKPHIPYGDLLIRIANVNKLKTIIAGSYVNINQYLLIKNKVIPPNNESNTRFLIDKQKISFSIRDKKNWDLFTDESKKIIQKHETERIFIFSSKSGLFPTTICNDCKNVLTCDICKAPMRLIEKNNKSVSSPSREFVCPRCEDKINANIHCPKCTSWNLKPFGIGSERVVESLKTNYPDIKVYYLDENETITNIKKTLNLWNESNGILIGSERILNKITNYPENIIFISIDSLFGIPNYRISERVIELILNANDFATKKLHIITGLKDEYLFNELRRGSLKMFYDDELADRQNLNFPPYGYLLNIKKLIKPNNKYELSGVKKLLRELDKNIEISAYAKNQGQNIIIATGLYTPEVWHTKIAPNITKLTDQSFDIYINETDWLN